MCQIKCGVLQFISPSFVASRYCCREVRFADALNKPIIPAVLGQAELGSVNRPGFVGGSNS
jgi:hypothetical protein